MTPRYDLLRRGLWIIRQLPDERVKLSQYRQPCGTIACAFGHMALDPVIARDLRITWEKADDGRLFPWSETLVSWAAAEEVLPYYGQLLGLNFGEAARLFHPRRPAETTGTDRAVAIARLTKFLSDAGELDGPIPGVTDTAAAVDALKASMLRAVETRQLVEGDD